MKEEIQNVLSIFMPLGLVVATLLNKPALGCVIFAIGFIATLEIIKRT
tara:strand:- start:870 stop:1013 length:144 start_codon:yes stop_codon:yes gene_type:complete